MPRWHPPSLPPNPRLIRGTLLSCFSSQLRNGCWPRTSTPPKEWGREPADPVMAAARVKELARAWALARRNLQAAPRVKRRVALVEHRVARAVLCLAVRHQEEAAWCQR